ncbi:hypothetical protein TNCV_1306361 [Trichonephila clavipes]|nr:hypothetical protein TNCV_1306361 [Trichonephila clavipes]
MYQRSSVGEGRSVPTSSDVTNQSKQKVYRDGGYNSVVEHSTADREVLGSNTGVRFFRECELHSQQIYLKRFKCKNGTQVWVARNPPGFAFIDFEDDEAADEAIKEMNGATINGSEIRVDVSRSNGRRGRGGGGGGFRGGRDGGFSRGGRGGGSRYGGGDYGSGGYRSRSPMGQRNESSW